MKLGNRFFYFSFLILFFFSLSYAEDKIISTPLINLEKIKPSFEESNETSENPSTKQYLKKKEKIR